MYTILLFLNVIVVLFIYVKNKQLFGIMNNQILKSLSIIMVIGLVSIPLCTTASVDSISDRDLAQDSVTGETYGKYNIVVLTDKQITRSETYENNVRFQNTLEQINSEDIIIIDGTWIEKQNENIVSNGVKSLVDRGNPIILASDSAELISADTLNHPTGFSPSADLYGIIYNRSTDTTYCYSVTCEDDKDPYNMAFRWIDLSKSILIQKENEVNPKGPILCSVSETASSFGTITAGSTNTIYKIDSNTSLILTEHSLVADPETESSIWDNWISVADMMMSCNHLDSDVICYGPVESSGDGVYEVALNTTYSGVNVNKHWEYTIDDSDLEDNTTGDYIEIVHDVDERGNSKLDTRVMNPGTISIATKGNNQFLYEETEYYYANFYKDSTLVSDKYQSCECQIDVRLI